MELQTIAIIVLFLILVINIVATIMFFKTRIGNTTKQRIIQLFIIWFIPIIGAILIIMLRKSLDEPLLSVKEHEKERRARETNKEMFEWGE